MLVQNRQGIKILLIYDLISRMTDEHHAIASAEVVKILRSEGVRCSNRTLPWDIELLNLYGFEVLSYRKSRNKYYYVREGKLDSSDILYIVNVLTTQVPIKERKFLLIKKLMSMVSTKRAEFFSKHVLYDEVSFWDKELFRTIEALETAICSNSRVSFRYYSLDTERHRVYAENGDRISIAPLTIVWNGKRYSLIGYSKKEKALKVYRLDKMDDVKWVDGPGLPKGYAKYETAHREELFELVSGKKEKFVLEFDESVLEMVFDRFGLDQEVTTVGGKCYIEVSAPVTAELFGWILSSGGKITVKSPSETAERFAAFVQEIKNNY